MTRQTQFTKIVIHEQLTLLIPFLQSLTEAEKLTLIPYLQVLNQEYLTYYGQGYTRGRRATDTQVHILGIASFVCLDRESFEKANVHDQVLQEGVLETLLPWYCPAWFSEYVNHYAESHYLPTCFSYDYLIRMMQKGWVRPQEEVVTQFLPQLIYELRDHQWVYCPENLTRHAIALEQHLWYLFRYETNINWSDRYLLYGEEDQQETDWKCTLKLLADGGKVNRRRLLRETIEAASRPFNQALHQWFVTLLLYLEPTQEELLSATMQPTPTTASHGTRSIAEVCQELFSSTEDRPQEEPIAPRRERRPLPIKALVSREPQPYPKEMEPIVPE